MGTTERREREKEERRRTILKAAKKLFFRKGLENTTMDEVAEESELSKGTLYIYFQNKESLALSVIQDTSDILNNRIRKAVDSKKSGIERIADMTEALADFYKKKKDEFHFLRYMDSITSSLGSGNETLKNWILSAEEMINVVLDVVRDGINDGSIRDDIEPEKAAFIYSNMILSFLIRLASNQNIILMSPSLSEDEIIENMFKMITKMLEPRKNDNEKDI